MAITILSSKITYIDVLDFFADFSAQLLAVPESDSYTSILTNGTYRVQASGEKTTHKYLGETYSSGYRDYKFFFDGQLVAKANYFFGQHWTSFAPPENREVPEKEASGEIFAAEVQIAHNVNNLDFRGAGNEEQIVKPGQLFGDGYATSFHRNGTVLMGGGDDYVDTGKGRDRLFGDGGSDVLKGGIGGDTLHGGRGSDRLHGGAGKDKLFGDTSSDRISGGEDNDELSGGRGRDKFFFADNSGQDAILDFQNNKDTIVLDTSLWNGSKSVRRILNKFGDRDGDDFVLNFSSGEEITIKNTQKSDLLNDILIV